MQAVVKIGSAQLLVQPGQHVTVARLPGEINQDLNLDQVLLLIATDGIQVGRPYVATATVVAKIIAHIRGSKIRVGKFKAKSRYRKVRGFRADLTQISITDIRVK